MCNSQEAVFENVVRWLHAGSGCDSVIQTRQPRRLGESLIGNVFGHLSEKVPKCAGEGRVEGRMNCPYSCSCCIITISL